ncbi:lipopolysaccharide biosynthesis protein (plasmid) [Gloeothece citriformis PCC 7424]|uniref:non-specific protein-tyrosine kinase n=1 Tax=Gloeothece citriformis (strain PCC 7424) TaxID=65393 RepID=B7KM10_GLOC7|nr:polysaccharide biosynthesis tyrosine autokinase [Gloeothece citriformis]ACK73832.1 lipopolysaccharide biosynthesis protein [Gloeothece citriformis PCC 7424]
MTNENGFSSLENTCEDINLWRAIRHHWIPTILVTLGVFGANVYQTSQETPIYQSDALILVANQVSVPVVNSEDDSLSNEVDSTEIEILKSPTLLAKVSKKLAPGYQDLGVHQIASNLSLSQPNNTNVLTVSYRDTDPQRAKAVVEALVSTYINYAKESQRSPVTNAIRFIEQQLPEARAALNQSSSALTEFRRKHNLDNPDSNAQLASQTKQQSKERVAEAEIALNLTEQKYQQLQRQITEVGQDPSTAIIDSVLSQDSAYQSLLTQLREIEIQYTLEKTRYASEHPILQDLKDRRDEIKRLLENHVQNLIGTQKSRLADKTVASGDIQQDLANQLLQTRIDLAVQKKQLNELRQIETQANLNFQRIVQLQQEYRELERQYQFNSQAVDDFLKKLQELRVREAQETSSWKLLEPPEVPTVSTANPRRQLLLALVAGSILGIGTAFLLDKADKRLKDVDKVKKIAGLPMLGVIPKVDQKSLIGKSQEIELSSKADAFTEALRSLALVLQFQKSSSHSQSTKKIIAITSSVDGEGKTTITYNLGLALAELGQRVLIVDANLNQPAIHQVFQLPNTSGLSTAIATDIPWLELIQSHSPKNLRIVSDCQENINSLQSSSQTIAVNGTKSIFARVLTSPTAPINQESGTLEQRYQKLVLSQPDILTSGPVPATPLAWLASEKMMQMLDQWRKAYNYVLIDTPSLTELADAQSLTPKVDEVILTVDMELITDSMLTETIEILRRNQSNISGLVINNLDLKKEKKSPIILRFLQNSISKKRAKIR